MFSSFNYHQHQHQHCWRKEVGKIPCILCFLRLTMISISISIIAMHWGKEVSEWDSLRSMLARFLSSLCLHSLCFDQTWLLILYFRQKSDVIFFRKVCVCSQKRVFRSEQGLCCVLVFSICFQLSVLLNSSICWDCFGQKSYGYHSANVI